MDIDEKQLHEIDSLMIKMRLMVEDAYAINDILTSQNKNLDKIFKIVKNIKTNTDIPMEKINIWNRNK